MTHTHGSSCARAAVAALFFLCVAGAAAAAPAAPPQGQSADAPAPGGWLVRELRKFRSYPRLDRAYRLIDAGRLEDARTELTNAIAIDPDSVQIRAVYVAVLSRLGRYNDVVQQANELLRRDPAHAAVLVYRGRARQALRDPRGALVDFTTAASLPDIPRSDRLEALDCAANAALQAGDRPAALHALDDLVLAAPSYSVHERRAAVLQQLGRVTDAAAAHAAAAVVATTDADRSRAKRAATTLRARAKDKDHDSRRASTATMAAASPDRNPDAALSLGWALAASGRAADAAEHFRVTADRTGTDAALKAAAYMLHRAGRTEEALPYAQRLAPRTRDAETSAQLAIILEAGGDVSGAAALLRASVARAATPAAAHESQRQLAFVLRRAGRDEEAHHELRALLTSGSPDADVVSAFTDTALRLDRRASALDLLRGLLPSVRHAEVRIGIGNAFDLLGDRAGALQVYETLLGSADRPADSTDLTLRVARLRTQLGQATAAADAYRALLPGASAPDPRILSEAADAFIAVRRYAEGAAVNARLLALPDLPPAVHARGLARDGYVQTALGDDARAQSAFEAALVLDPGNDLVRRALATVLIRRREWTRAADELARLSHPDGRALTDLAVSYDAIGRRTAAIETLRRAVAPDAGLETPELVRAERMLGAVSAAEHDYDGAIRAWTHAQSLAPLPAIALQIGVAQRLAGRGEESRITLDAIATDNLPATHRLTLLQERALTYLAVNERPAAIDVLRQALTYDPPPAVEYQLALLYRQAGDVPSAIALFEAAVAAEPKNATYVSALAYAHAASRDAGAATQLLERALQLQPSNAALYEQLAYLYEASGDRQQAMASVERGLDQLRDDGGSARPAAADQAERLRRFRHATVSSDHPWTASVYSAVAPATPGRWTLDPDAARRVTQTGVDAQYRLTSPSAAVNVQVFGRMMFAGAPTVSSSTLAQAGVGIRVKPLRSQSLFVSGERLMGLSTGLTDAWLLRAAYSWTAAPPADRRTWHYSWVYADTARTIASPIAAAFHAGELREGITFQPSSRVRISPHGSMEGRFIQQQSASTRDVAAGAGVAVQLLLDRTGRPALEMVARFRIYDWNGSAAPQPIPGRFVWVASMMF